MKSAAVPDPWWGTRAGATFPPPRLWTPAFAGVTTREAIFIAMTQWEAGVGVPNPTQGAHEGIWSS